MIEFQSTTKLYGSVIGVNDLSLTIEPGVHGLLGPNGSGKTTLINLIIGQLRPTLGRVRVFGLNPWRNESVLRRIGLCPASELLIPHVSADDWVTYQTELYGFAREEARQRAHDALRKVGLAESASRRPIGTYSLGMRQRTKLAQAIAHDPQLLILDEPFNGLDPVGRHEMNELLRRFADSGGSILLASHVLHELEAIKPSFLLISGGRLLASGSPQEVRRLLIDLPNEVEIDVNEPQRLAAAMVAEIPTDSIKFPGEGTMVVVTRHPRMLFEKLPAWIDRLGLQVHRLKTHDESLQDLFSTLMRRHRGEL